MEVYLLGVFQCPSLLSPSTVAANTEAVGSQPHDAS